MKLLSKSSKFGWQHTAAAAAAVRIQLLRSLLHTCHRSQFTPRPTHIIYRGETQRRGDDGSARPESWQFETVEREVVLLPCPRCLYFYCGECVAWPRASFSKITTRYRYIRSSDVPPRHVNRYTFSAIIDRPHFRSNTSLV